MKLTVEMILRSLNQIRRVYVDRLQERMPEENLSPNEIFHPSSCFPTIRISPLRHSCVSCWAYPRA